METLAQVLMRRDGLTEAQADADIARSCGYDMLDLMWEAEMARQRMEARRARTR